MNLGHPVLSLGQLGPRGLRGLLPSAVFGGPEQGLNPLSLTPSSPDLTIAIVFSGQVVNNYLDANESVSSEAPLSRMHFHDNQRKVDYVLAYHHRKRGAHPSHSSPGQSLAIISNGETGKEPHAGASRDIELGRLDALEEERKEQREEFEHNLMEAGLELEKDVEVRLGRCHKVVGWDDPAGLGSR